MLEIVCNICGKVIQGDYEDFGKLAQANGFTRNGKYFVCEKCKGIEIKKGGATEFFAEQRAKINKPPEEFPQEKYEKVFGKKIK